MSDNYTNFPPQTYSSSFYLNAITEVRQYLRLCCLLWHEKYKHCKCMRLLTDFNVCFAKSYFIFNMFQLKNKRQRHHMLDQFKFDEDILDNENLNVVVSAEFAVFFYCYYRDFCSRWVNKILRAETFLLFINNLAGYNNFNGSFKFIPNIVNVEYLLKIFIN